MNNKSYISNATSHDNTFNFGNQLDISNGKKDRTGEMFFKQAYDFNDFQNIGDDKTVKSSNYKARNHNTSNILKRQADQFSNHFIGNSILDNQFNNTGFNNSKSNIEGSTKNIYFQKDKYPKFGDRKASGEQNLRATQKVYQKQNYATTDQNNNGHFRSSDLSYTRSNVDAQDPSGLRQQSKNIGLGVDSRITANKDPFPNFRKKDVVYSRPQPRQDQLENKQMQYRQLVSMINFYKNQSQKMNYQRMVLEEQSINQLIAMANSQTYEEQIKNNLESINSLNTQIQKQKSIQKKMTRVIAELQEQYHQIIQSVNQMDFKRPALIKDQAKVLIDQINQLKSQFQALQRDTGSLNLSCTIFGNTPLSVQNRLKGSHTQNFKESANINELQEGQSYLTKILQDIHEQNSRSEDTQFLKNLKLASLKEQWKVFENKQLIVSLTYKLDETGDPTIVMRIGNKTYQLLQKFNIQIQVRSATVKLMENQVLNKKSFLVEGIKLSPENFAQVFIKINITYQMQFQDSTNSQAKTIKFFCPTGILNFGQFAPVTFKEFESELSLPLLQIQSPLKPYDKSLINGIDEIRIYFPNLKIWEGQTTKVYGLFMSIFNEGTLLIIQQHNDLIRIKLKNGNRSLLKLLEFILTV